MQAVEVHLRGALFDGRLEHAIDAATVEAEQDIADAGVNVVRQRLHQVLQHPTGRYERHVVTERHGADRAVTDGRVVYGPWLEGVSQRNRTTRFRGYQTFRQATRELNSRSVAIADRAIADRIGGMK